MSILTTQKQLKELSIGIAEDITHYNEAQIKELRENEGYFNEIACSRGMYGCNGLLLQGNNSKCLYKITRRVSTLFSI